MTKTILTLSTLFILLLTGPTFSQEKELNFDAKYIKANQGKTTIEINEAQELVYILSFQLYTSTINLKHDATPKKFNTYFLFCRN